MNSGKPCVLMVEKGDDTRVFVFESHLDASDIAAHFRKAGYGWAMYPYEHIPLGDRPANLPLAQLELFEEGVGDAQDKI